MTKLIDRAARTAPLWTVASVLALSAAAMSHAAEPKSVAGVICNSPPRINCPEANCLPALSGYQGDAVEPKSGRKFLLDFPCDYKPGEQVIFILNIHGAGSVGNWQRHYFPAIDDKEKYRLVVATPTAKADMPGRTWQAANDDKFLEDVSSLVIDAFGKQNIKSFWLAGHSQGGITSRRIVCSPYFRSRVDGFISLSGGRIGTPTPPPGATPTAAPGAAPGRGAAPAGAPARGPAAAPPPLDCDFSFIYGTGELEAAGAVSARQPSTWAERYACGPRVREPDIVDTRAGYVTATDQTRGPSWGRFARPGKAEVQVYTGCKDGRVVADIVRLDKGHTEGYEPQILDRILKLMASIPGGKLRSGRG